MTANHGIPTVGVSVAFIQRFKDEFVSKHRLYSNATADACDKFIKPVTQSCKNSFVDYYNSYNNSSCSNSNGSTEYNSKYFGKATRFVSHAWKCDFMELLESLVDWSKNQDKRNPQANRNQNHKIEYFWIDVFVNNQHSTNDYSSEWWETTFPSFIKSIGSTLVVLLPLRNSVYLTRIWCLYEFYQTLQTDTKYEIITSPHWRKSFIEKLDPKMKDGLKTRLNNGKMSKLLGWGHIMNSEMAIATSKSDEQSIKMAISKFTTFADLNSMINGALKLFQWMPSMLESVKFTNDDSHVFRHNVAIAWSFLNEHKKAEMILKQSLDLQCSELKSPNLNVEQALILLKNKYDHRACLSSDLRATGRSKEAFEFKFTPPLLTTYSQYGSELVNQERFEEAVVVLKICFVWAKNNLMKSNWDIWAYELDYAWILEKQGLHAEAEPLIAESSKMKKYYFGDEPSAAFTIIDTLKIQAFNLAKLNRKEEAQKIWDESEELLKSAIASGHPCSSSTSNLNKLANFQMAMGDFIKAEENMKKVLELEKRSCGNDESNRHVRNTTGKLEEIQKELLNQQIQKMEITTQQ